MQKLLLFSLVAIVLVAKPLYAADTLVLDIEVDKDLLSLAHNIEDFFFQPTMNFSPEVPGNLSERIKTTALQNHLLAAFLVTIDGEPAGIAAELENVDIANSSVESGWLILLSHPKASGFLAVKQNENPAGVIALFKAANQNPKADWEDKFHRVLSTVAPVYIEMASESLSAYKGGRFEEYNYVNQADLKNYNRFRAKLQFVIYPGE